MQYKKTCQIINNILSSKKYTFKPTTLTDDNGNIHNNTDTANKFNEHFSNVGPTLAARIGVPIKRFEHYLSPSPPTSAVFNFTYPAKIESIIKNLKSSSAVGVNDITIKIIKIVAHIIATTLSNPVNNSLETGIFSSALRISKVIPIFKTGDQKYII